MEKNPAFWKVATLLWGVLLLYLTLTPAPPQVPGPLGWDKLQHAAAFGILAFLVSVASASTAPRAALTGLISATLFGGIIELLQASLTSWRTGDIWDLLADLTGAAMATFVFLCTADSKGRSA